jgi:predicted transposase/invertase (TIGR01784 family)
MEIGAFTREQLQIYDNTKIGIMTAQSFIDDAEEKGLAKGLAKGEEIGLAKGKEIGLVEGRNEEKIEIARKLLSLGVSVENIAKSTGLTVEQISKQLNTL